MDVEWGPDAGWGSGPRLDEFLLARIAEDKHIATDAAAAGGAHRPRAPGPVRADTGARRVLREARHGAGLPGRPAGPGLPRLPAARHGRLPLTPTDQHQLAALTLALLALPYEGHKDYRPEWRP